MGKKCLAEKLIFARKIYEFTVLQLLNISLAEMESRDEN